MNDKFIASNWKARQQNTLQGFVSVQMPSGLVIHECSVHQKDDSRWIGMPARAYEAGGERKWAKLVDFDGKDSSREWQTLALQAIDELCGGVE